MEQHSKESQEGLTRQDIIDAAARLFRQKGYASTNMQEIAAALGVTKAALYYYFRSKEEILATICDQTMATAEKRLAKLMERPLSVPERIRQIIYNHIMSVFDDAPYISVFFNERLHLAPDNLEKITRRRRQYEEKIADVLREGIARGILKPVDVLPTVYAILGMCNWLYQWYKPDGRLKPEEITDLFAEIVLRGLLVPSAS